jgi:hypothetical protein
LDNSDNFARILLEAPRKCWLALTEDESKVVGHGKTPEEAVEAARANGVDDPILIWAPEVWTPRIF